MAGSFDHCLNEDGTYRGMSLLENTGDMEEAIEHMAFMLLRIKHVFGGNGLLKMADDEYYECMRGERPWPEFMKNRAR